MSAVHSPSPVDTARHADVQAPGAYGTIGQDAVETLALPAAAEPLDAGCRIDLLRAPRDRDRFPPASARAATLDAIVQAIRAGEPSVVVTGEDGPGRTTLVDAALVALGPGFHVLRLGNPLSSPLSLGRVLIQLGSSDQEAADGNELDAALHALKARRSSEDQVVITVEEAETLEPEALSFLAMLPSVAAVGLPQLQLLLAGSPSLLALVERQQVQGSSERIETHLAIGPSAPEEIVDCVEHGPRCRETVREEPRPGAVAGVAERAGGDLQRADVPLVRALRRGKGVNRFAAAIDEVPTGAPPRTEGAIAIGPALPAAAPANAAALAATSGQLAARPAPSTVEEGSESGNPGDAALPVVPGMGNTAWSGRRMAGTLVALACLLGAILANFLSEGSLSHWAILRGR